jgi:hypothetical protein
MTLPSIRVEITIKDNATGRNLTIPVLPINGDLEYSDGDQRPISVDILDLGAVEIPAGVELDSCGWESFFPARHDPSYSSVGPHDCSRHRRKLGYGLQLASTGRPYAAS